RVEGVGWMSVGVGGRTGNPGVSHPALERRGRDVGTGPVRIDRGTGRVVAADGQRRGRPVLLDTVLTRMQAVAAHHDHLGFVVLPGLATKAGLVPSGADTIDAVGATERVVGVMLFGGGHSRRIPRVIPEK